jgi:hypothetical protein
MAKRKAQTDDTDYALLGAQTRLAQLRDELNRLYKKFPQLSDDIGIPRPAVKKRKTRKFSPEQREAARKRMTLYWKNKKKQAKAE